MRQGRRGGSKLRRVALRPRVCVRVRVAAAAADRASSPAPGQVRSGQVDVAPPQVNQSYFFPLLTLTLIPPPPPHTHLSLIELMFQ